MLQRPQGVVGGVVCDVVRDVVWGAAWCAVWVLVRHLLQGRPLHHHQVPRAQAQPSPGPGAQRGRGVQEHDAALLCLHPGQHGRQQAHFTHTGVGQQQLGQCMRRPARARQLSVQRSMPTGPGGHALMAQLVRAPQGGVQVLQRGCGLQRCLQRRWQRRAQWPCHAPGRGQLCRGVKEAWSRCRKEGGKCVHIITVLLYSYQRKSLFQGGCGNLPRKMSAEN